MYGRADAAEANTIDELLRQNKRVLRNLSRRGSADASKDSPSSRKCRENDSVSVALTHARKTRQLRDEQQHRKRVEDMRRLTSAKVPSRYKSRSSSAKQGRAPSLFDQVRDSPR